MPELNTLQSIEHADQDGFDTLTVIDQGEALSLCQVTEDGTPETVVIGMAQAKRLRALLDIYVTEGNA